MFDNETDFEFTDTRKLALSNEVSKIHDINYKLTGYVSEKIINMLNNYATSQYLEKNISSNDVTIYNSFIWSLLPLYEIEEIDDDESVTDEFIFNDENADDSNDEESDQVFPNIEDVLRKETEIDLKSNNIGNTVDNKRKRKCND